MSGNWIQYFDDISTKYFDIIEKADYKSDGYYEIILKNNTTLNVFISLDGNELYDVVIWNEQFGLPVEDLSYLFNSSPFNEQNVELIKEILKIPFERGWTLVKYYYKEKLEYTDVYYGIGIQKEEYKAFSSSDYSYSIKKLFKNLFMKVLRINDKKRRCEIVTINPDG